MGAVLRETARDGVETGAVEAAAKLGGETANTAAPDSKIATAIPIVFQWCILGFLG